MLLFFLHRFGEISRVPATLLRSVLESSRHRRLCHAAAAACVVPPPPLASRRRLKMSSSSDVSAAEQQGYGVWDKNMLFWTVQTSNLTSVTKLTIIVVFLLAI